MGRVIRVEKRALHIGDPDQRETPMEFVAWRCTLEDLTYGNLSTVWMPIECPVSVGDQIWTQSYFAFWSSGPVHDRRYMQADRGWNFDGTPVYERKAMG